MQSCRIISLLLRIINEHDPSFNDPMSVNIPSVMDCNNGRSKEIISIEFIQYFQILLSRNFHLHDVLMKWIVDLEDLIIQIFNIDSIPRITNEPL